MRALWIRFIEPRHQSFVRDDLFMAHCIVATTHRMFYLNKNDNCEFMMMANLFFFVSLYRYSFPIILDLIKNSFRFKQTGAFLILLLAIKKHFSIYASISNQQIHKKHRFGIFIFIYTETTYDLDVSSSRKPRRKHFTNFCPRKCVFVPISQTNQKL